MIRTLLSRVSLAAFIVAGSIFVAKGGVGLGADDKAALAAYEKALARAAYERVKVANDLGKAEISVLLKYYATTIPGDRAKGQLDYDFLGSAMSGNILGIFNYADKAITIGNRRKRAEATYQTEMRKLAQYRDKLLSTPLPLYVRQQLEHRHTS